MTPRYAEDLTLRRVYAYAVVVLTAGALLSASTSHLEQLSEGSRLGFWHPLIWELTGFYAVLAFLPIAYHVTRRWPMSRALWLRRGLLHLGVAFVLSVLTTTTFYLLRVLIYWALGLGEYRYGILAYRYLFEFHKFLVVYAAFQGLLWMHGTIASAREREAAAARLAQDLAEARLASLTAQVNPHFLFNCLNTVSSLMYDDVRRADTMISRLSDFLRVSLEHSGRPVVALAEEVRFLELYVDLMKARFGSRLQVTIDVADELGLVPAPAFVLQPLVENAIKHHSASNGEVIVVRVAAERAGKDLALTVTDNGPGIEGDSEKGVGLRNLRARLRHLYGDAHDLSLANQPGGGLEVRLRLPLADQGVTTPERSGA